MTTEKIAMHLDQRRVAFSRIGEIAISANFTKSTGSFPPFFFCLFYLLRMVRLLHLELLRERYVPSRNRRLNYVLGSQKA
jgi:hypothetical protein